MTLAIGPWLIPNARARGFAAALFDLDGVITPTAEVHMAAWRAMFTEYFTARGISPAYTDDDYFAYVDGKPRYDGVRECLASRGVTLPEGLPSDEPTAETVCGLGNAKNAAFASIVRDDGVVPYPGSVELLDHLASVEVAMAIVSSSRNATEVLAAAGLADRFRIVVDGVEAERRGLLGKPSPETYLYAAAQLGIPTDGCVVIEDAIPGVEAGASGGFGLVVGVDRGAGAAELMNAGADMVVSDLAELVAR